MKRNFTAFPPPWKNLFGHPGSVHHRPLPGKYPSNAHGCGHSGLNPEGHVGWKVGLLDGLRGVTRLDGARGKKQVWRPHVRTWDLSETNVLYWRKYLWNCWDFSASPAVIRRPGNCKPFAALRYAYGRPAEFFKWHIAKKTKCTSKM